MKKCMCLILCLLSFGVLALPSQDSFDMTLSNVYQGQCDEGLIGAPLEITYNFDFEKNIGLAHLTIVGETPVNIDLFPLGVASRYMFMSDIKPTPVEVNGESTYLYRIIFDLSKEGDAAAMIMFGKEGNCILSTDNYDKD